ncbi:flagellar motor switch protein FliG [Arenibacterium halophilum]|uniref:Flagellar motor switch protein FliG n=1 Tax=Arenibacterium halophilum TaxID=2583821 RepID=A0ABY2XB52_9RHOB|nr:FliG C-terminal domain-containing protein [Arenibacterium halophilum]TMV13285.1 flagellar motor switch protein FliG [Arenibacterium halophilum]
MQDNAPLMGLPMMMGGGDTKPSPTPSGGSPAALDRRAKAAIVVRLLMNHGADIPLESLPDELQAALTQKMGRMGLIDKATMTAVAEEFADALEALGLAFPKGIAGALSALDGKISPQTAARLRKEAGVRQLGDPWDRLRAAKTDELLAIAQAESIEVAAVLLSKLETVKAAELLGKLPGPLARRITYAISQTGRVTPDAVDRIGLSLAAQLDDRPEIAFEDDPGARVGAILNISSKDTRDDMLSSLDETDAEFAERVRKEIFTFAHISARVKPTDVPAVVRAVDPNVLVTALAGATDEQTSGVVEFLFSNMSQRMADNLRDEVTDRGKVKGKDAEAAMNEVVIAIRELIQIGDIELVVPDDEDGEEE